MYFPHHNQKLISKGPGNPKRDISEWYHFMNSIYVSLFFSELSTVSLEISEFSVSEELVEEDPELKSK